MLILFLVFIISNFGFESQTKFWAKLGQAESHKPNLSFPLILTLLSSFFLFLFFFKKKHPYSTYIMIEYDGYK